MDRKQGRGTNVRPQNRRLGKGKWRSVTAAIAAAGAGTLVVGITTLVVGVGSAAATVSCSHLDPGSAKYATCVVPDGNGGFVAHGDTVAVTGTANIVGGQVGIDVTCASGVQVDTFEAYLSSDGSSQNTGVVTGNLCGGQYLAPLGYQLDELDLYASGSIPSPSPAECVTLTDGNISQYGTLNWSATKATVTLKERDGGYCNNWSFSQVSYALVNPPKLWPQTVAAVSSAKVGKSGLSASATVNATTCGQNDGYTGSGPKVGDKLSGPGKDYEATHKLLSSVFGGPNSWDVETSGCNQPPCPIVGELKCGLNHYTVNNLVVRGEKGSSHLVAQVTVPAALQGKSVHVSVDVVNSGVNGKAPSVHPDSTVILSSDGTSITLNDVEGSANKKTSASGTLTLGKTVDVTVVLGPDGVFSGGGDLTVDVDCSQPTQTPTPTPTYTPPAPVINPTASVTECPPSVLLDNSASTTQVGLEIHAVDAQGNPVGKGNAGTGLWTETLAADQILPVSLGDLPVGSVISVWWDNNKVGGPVTLGACTNPTPGPTPIATVTPPTTPVAGPTPNKVDTGLGGLAKGQVSDASSSGGTSYIMIAMLLILAGLGLIGWSEFRRRAGGSAVS